METSLKTIKYNLKNILNLLKYSETPSGGSIMILNNLVSLRKGIIKMRELRLFDDQIKLLLDTTIFTSVDDSMRIQGHEASVIRSTTDKLLELIENLSLLFDVIIPNEDPYSINIKLPPSISNFVELSDVSIEINTALSQVIFNDDIKGDIVIKSVENGSIWLNVFLGAAAVRLVAGIVWAACVIRKKKAEGALLEEQVRGLEIKNNALQEIQEALGGQLKNLTHLEATNLFSEHYNTEDKDQVERIKNSIKLFADLIMRGAEIQPALVAPENISNLFPDIKNVLGIISKVKQIDSPHSPN